MKKSVLYVIIVILLCVVSSGVTYIVMNSKNKEVVENSNKENVSNDNVEDKEQENIKEEIVLEDSVELVDTYKENDKIIQEFKIVLNGKEKNLKLTYTVRFDPDPGVYIIEGKYNGVVFNYLGFEIEDNENYTKENTFTISNIENSFDEENFRIITGLDNKKYLAVVYYNYYGNILYVYNEDFKLISDNIGQDVYSEWEYEGFVINHVSDYVIRLENGIKPWYIDQFDIDNKSRWTWKCYSKECEYVKLKIENNKIYYLARVVKDDSAENDYGILEERIYTIKDDKLEYKVINTYNILEVEKD